VKRAVRYTRLSERPPVPVTFRWSDAQGKVILVHTGSVCDRQENAGTDMWFPPGTWRLEVVTGSGRSAETTFEVTERAAADEPILIRMP
jgi:hypothetical protein